MLAAIVAAPGITYAELGAVVGVSRDTAGRYVAMLGGQVDAVKGTGKSGPGARMRLFPVVASSHVVAQAQCDDSATTPEAIEEPAPVESSHRRSTYIGATTPRATTPASPSDSEEDGLKLSVEWPEI